MTLPRSIPNITPAKLFSLLPGTYKLSRTLTTSNPAEPSGNCTGIASFTTVENGNPSESAELLYQEKGWFQVKASLPKMQFSKGYIWTLNHDDQAEVPEQISTWFIKPGTENERDYLFHAFSFDHSGRDASINELTLHAKGSHLCVKDMYDTEYWFHLREGRDSSDFNLEGWRMRHVVKGPKKDQLIETDFVKDR